MARLLERVQACNQSDTSLKLVIGLPSAEWKPPEFQIVTKNPDVENKCKQSLLYDMRAT